MCPGQDDVRLMLAEQMARAGRIPEALEQLQTLYEAMLAEDRGTEAAATLDRIRALDPDFAPRAGMSRQEAKRKGLVFLDVDYDRRGAVDGPAARAPEQVPDAATGPLPARDFGEVDLPESSDEHAGATLDASPLDGLTPLEDPLKSMVPEELRGPGPTMSEFQSTSFVPGDARSDDSAPDVTPLAIEQTSYDSLSPDFVQAGHDEPPDPPSDNGVWQALDDAHSDSDATPPSDASESIAETLTGYVASLSNDVADVAGGLPADLGVLPVEAVQDQQDSPPRSPRGDDEFVDLKEWLLEDEAPMNPRMTAAEEERPANTVQTDFSEMLETFKAGVAANVDESDADSHYDLGVAYMEMGLFDEAIAQFQKAMRADTSAEGRVRAYESLGQSFIEKNEDEVAISSLGGALNEPGLNDAKLVGVLYLLGYASERLGRWQDAERYYRRVFAADINFRDIADRLKRAEQMA